MKKHKKSVFLKNAFKNVVVLSEVSHLQPSSDGNVPFFSEPRLAELLKTSTFSPTRALAEDTSPSKIVSSGQNDHNKQQHQQATSNKRQPSSSVN